jgi:tRNA (adenine57-N1/adenine58-N1)-methyltransferase
MNQVRALSYGESVLIWDEEKKKSFLFVLKPGGQLGTHKGKILHDEIAGKPEGSLVLSSTGARFRAFRPFVTDRIMKVQRKTQIVYPKDAAWLILAMDLKPGMKIIEMGTGSGAFTILLAQLVGPEGKIYTFDRREEFLKNAEENLKKAGLKDRVVFGSLNAGEPFPVKDVDAVFLDLPEPWLAVHPAWEALAPGKALAIIVPTAEQLKKSVEVLKEEGFAVIDTVEILERRLLVRKKEGVRPFEKMVGFTGYLISARKITKQ